ncbi:MAG: glutathione S-transferase [Halioglobus sp.]|nr:glutathione S-transferase [Halioglobus sp.]MCB1708630.1 glutathione S-transferase [Halioglobus sp.]MCP5122568.1 glutathione S-transferase [Pseudomonadales bacterium]MCP5191735.1 glutathione S-transferase [Pseudomonadales bacterium]
MLTVHHLNNSRSQRILWLLEELELPYELKSYQRNAETNLAPPALEAVHPLGKSPVLTDAGNTVIESGAIIDYILRRHGGGRLMPAAGSNEHEQYLQWLHYAEGSAMLPLMLRMYTGRLPDGGAALQPRINDELNRHLGYMNRALDGVDWFVGNTFSGADVQLSFVAELAPLLHPEGVFPNLAAMRERFQARPAYQRALKKGGKYDFGPAGQ